MTDAPRELPIRGAPERRGARCACVGARVRELGNGQARLDMPLEQQLAELKAVYAAMHDGLVVFDARGEAVVVNEAAARLLGFESRVPLEEGLRRSAHWYESNGLI